MMTEESPWLGGPDVTKAEFKEHLAKRAKVEEFRQRCQFNPPGSFYLGPDDDVVEYLTKFLSKPIKD
jgi:hypothetical protein